MKRFCALGLAAFLVAGCGTSAAQRGTSRPATAAAARAASSPHVAMVTAGAKYAFRPMKITVHQGAVVTWVNDSNADHTVTADDGSWSSDNLSRGQSYTRRFTKPGRYDYVCGLHGYMTGVVIVR